jgi:hypothetical protein
MILWVSAHFGSWRSSDKTTPLLKSLAASARRPTADEIEPLDRTDRHWIIDPAGVVLLLTPDT